MNKNLSVRDIAQYVKWKDVKRAIKFYYPSDKNDYQKLFEGIATSKKVKVKPGLFLQVYGGLDVNTEWYEKFGQKFLDDMKKGDESQYYSIDMVDTTKSHDWNPGKPAVWSISFQPWAKLLNMPIYADTLLHYTFVDIIAHLIWEMTFYGPEKEMEKHAKELFKRAKEVKKQIRKKK